MIGWIVGILIITAIVIYFIGGIKQERDKAHAAKYLAEKRREERRNR